MLNIKPLNLLKIIAILLFGFYFINKITSINKNIKRILKKSGDNFIFLHHINSKNLLNDTTNINMLYPFKSRPFGFEDVILFYIFQHVKNGFYIDFGGYHPENYSVTKFFYDLGWNGINIEPVPEFYELFVKNRPREINLNAWGREKNGNCKLYVKNDVTSVIKNKFGKSNNVIIKEQLTAKTKNKNIEFSKLM